MNKFFKQQLWQWRGVLLVIPTISALVLGLRTVGALQHLELMAFDQFVRLRPAEPPDDRIVIVGIDENDLRAIGTIPIPDRDLAELITTLNAMEPRMIGLDIYRDLPVEPGSETLANVLRTTENLIGIEKVVGNEAEQRVSASPILKEQNRIAANDLATDADGKIRRALLTLESSTGESHYSLAAMLAFYYLAGENPPRTIETAPDTDHWWLLNDFLVKPLNPNDGGYVNLDNGGYQTFLNYRSPRGHFETRSLGEVVTGMVPDDWAQDKLVLIGAVSESQQDLLYTPYTLSPNQRMPGVEIHANATSQLISAVLDDRPLLQTWSEWQEMLWILSWITLGSLGTWVLRHHHKSRYGVNLGLVILLVGGSFWALVQAWWLPLVPALLGYSGAAIAITAYIARSAGQIRNTFGRYLSNEIVSTLLESPEGLKLGGERKTITIFTSDLRGFTALSERLSPEEVVKILNFYLSHMAEVITKYQGTIDEFMGDGILVLFGAPIAREDDAARAIACGIEMQNALGAVNQQMAQWGLPNLEMGIGINTGEVVVGNIGSEKRTKYGIVGSQVNLTYRIESYTIGGQILISESTLQQAGSDLVAILQSKQVSPKGVKEPITIYEVGGIGKPYDLQLPVVVEHFETLAKPWPVTFSILQGKDILGVSYGGEWLQLSEREGELRLVDPPADPTALPQPLQNLKMNFTDLGDRTLEADFYVKVLEKPSKPGHVWVRFTARSPQITQFMAQLPERVPSPLPPAEEA